MAAQKTEYKIRRVGKSIAREWGARFGVTRKDGCNISEELIDELWNDICTLAENKGLDIGGGIKPVIDSVTDKS